MTAVLLLTFLIVAGCGSTPYNPAYEPERRGCAGGMVPVCEVRGRDRQCRCELLRDIFW